jgi:hypothetical protein
MEFGTLGGGVAAPGAVLFGERCVVLDGAMGSLGDVGAGELVCGAGAGDGEEPGCSCTGDAAAGGCGLCDCGSCAGSRGESSAAWGGWREQAANPIASKSRPTGRSMFTLLASHMPSGLEGMTVATL